MTIAPFKLERFFSRHEFAAQYLLCSSDCEAMTIGELLSLEYGAADKFNNHWLGYTETKGDPDLRLEISRLYSGISDSEILVCSGAEEPIFLFSHALLNAGDEVIFQFPCYQSLRSIPESIGCKVLKCNMKYENDNLIFDLDDLSNLITNRTKIIYINTPHNPTGFHFSKQEQLALIEIARKNNTIIFCDEVFRQLEHQPEFKLPAIADVYENGISLGVMSKAYGLAGLRIGWLATKNKEILEKVAVLKEYTTICNSAPSEFLATVALRNKDQILNRNLSIIKPNLIRLEDFFKKYSTLFHWNRPNAGAIGFVKMNFNEDDLIFTGQLLEKKQVLLILGEVFEFTDYFRLGFGRKNMPDALEKFEEYIIEDILLL